MQANTNGTLYYLLLNNQQAGPYTVGQLRTMWQNGVANAQTQYSFAGGASWQPLINLRTMLESLPGEPAPVSSAPQRVSVAGSTPRPHSTKTPSAILRYGGGFIVVCVAIGIYFSLNGTNSWFGRTMPLTEEMSLIYFQKIMKKAEETARANMANEAREDMATKQPQANATLDGYVRNGLQLQSHGA